MYYYEGGSQQYSLFTLDLHIYEKFQTSHNNLFTGQKEERTLSGFWLTHNKEEKEGGEKEGRKTNSYLRMTHQFYLVLDTFRNFVLSLFSLYKVSEYRISDDTICNLYIEIISYYWQYYSWNIIVNIKFMMYLKFWSICGSYSLEGILHNKHDSRLCLTRTSGFFTLSCKVETTLFRLY